MTTAFYPLQYAVERIGGDHVAVTTLTKPGAEPHDVELTPKQVAGLTEADLVVYEKGLQPAVDDAVALATGKTTVLDVSKAADLDLTIAEDDHSPEPEGAHTLDPHFWLDPVRYRSVAQGLADDLARLDPAHAQAYRDNLAGLVSDLDGLDTAYRTGVATCANRNLVTGHAAFGYLAARYGFTQYSVTGVSPDAEPSAAALRETVATVRNTDVRTVYAETLVSPALIDTIARETGAKVAVLDPIEGITDESAGADYLAVMRSNLATLQVGQQCR